MTDGERAAAEAELDRRLAELEARARALEAARVAPATKPSPFWLSHHPPSEYARTFSFAGVHVCARCLGTYPLLALSITAQLALGAPLVWRFDGPWSLGLLVPALVDWAVGRFRPGAGNNLLRLGTGVMLGLALGRTLYVHLRAPYPGWLWAQAAVVTAVAAPVIFIRWYRWHRRR